MKEFLTMKAL